MSSAHRVKITYCAECGYEPQTLDLAKALMLEFGARLSSIELIPWEGGTFEVSVDGQLIHSMNRDGGFPEAAAVKDAVRARLSGSSR
ncbi:MAG: SelT/SelW/SelH family protein [Chloroflexi bacterium]|nr:MAG: SelT/SelW/SelH family protein [Chloroflexota bacterium]